MAAVGCMGSVSVQRDGGLCGCLVGAKCVCVVALVWCVCVLLTRTAYDDRDAYDGVIDEVPLELPLRRLDDPHAASPSRRERHQVFLGFSVL